MQELLDVCPSHWMWVLVLLLLEKSHIFQGKEMADVRGHRWPESIRDCGQKETWEKHIATLDDVCRMQDPWLTNWHVSRLAISSHLAKRFHFQSVFRRSSSTREDPEVRGDEGSGIAMDASFHFRFIDCRLGDFKSW